MNQSFLVNGEGQDEAFIASLPKDLAELTRRQKLPDTNMPEEEYLEVIKDLHCEFDGHDAIDIWFGPQGPQWTSRGLLEKIAEQAESLGTNIQTHALESYIDKIEGHRSYGKSTIAYLDELGFLSPRLSMAHGTWLSQSDIETLAARGVNLIHCPSSNLRARQGIAPLNAAMQAGLLVALGMDGLTINDDDDLFNEMRLALQLHRTPEYNGRAPTTQEIVRMVTTDAARVMNRANEIGKLAPGYKADVLVLDLKEVIWPWVSGGRGPARDHRATGTQGRCGQGPREWRRRLRRRAPHRF